MSEENQKSSAFTNASLITLFTMVVGGGGFVTLSESGEEEILDGLREDIQETDDTQDQDRKALNERIFKLEKDQALIRCQLLMDCEPGD